ncbi:hypothetical protein HS041_37300 [Planomonospora sp. ID67723]|uniref:hypothetical protein n=1 Tax=Planomonospora sp. ID67723 TaxID=2738134 RepID=UPI0018C3E808|nr:hypothetical protein [Planomonospora sp. ID67723]MBG0833362.1 hypothetical protein [Planomonospora sp. ID67723]
MTLPPLILDTGILIELARGDLDTMEMVARFDSENQPMVMSVLSITGASLDSRSKDAGDLLLGITTLDQITVAGPHEPDHGVALATAINRTGLDPWDAHVAALANASICPVLTLDKLRWEQAARAFDEPLHIIEIADPGD